MQGFHAVVMAGVLLLAMGAMPAKAQEWRWHGDIHRFHEHDIGHWREGRWFHGFHGGRNGWWWIVGGFWYFYPLPVYPYPDPYTPPVIVTEDAPAPSIVVAPSVLYYCANPMGYYPYVAECAVPWQRVGGGSAMRMAPPVAAVPTVVVPGAPLQREVDIRQFHRLTAEFQSVNLADPHARAALKKLERRVQAFRQNLSTRGYNAADLLRDAEDLAHRIAAQRQQLPVVHGGVAAPFVPAPNVPVGTVHSLAATGIPPEHPPIPPP